MTSRLVPLPARTDRRGGGPFHLLPTTPVVVGDAGLDAAAALAWRLAATVGLPVLVEQTDPGGAHAVRLEQVGTPPDPDPLTGLPHPDAEAYTLDIAADTMLARASTPAGLHRAAATIAQLVAAEGTTLAARHVVDRPRYAWRGLSVDVARHFVALDDLLSLIDLLWCYKLGVLHLHLTDDQAWRLDLPSRPELVAESSGSSVGGGPGGAYRAKDWRLLLDHAASRGVVVVPEIDVPGHVNAALHACPELTEDGRPAPEHRGADGGSSRLRAGLPGTDRFLRDVFGNLAALTVGDHLHVGGDEVPTMHHAEYDRLVRRTAEIVRRAGKRVVGWQETATVELDPGSLVQVRDPYQDPAPLHAAVARGARLIASPGSRVCLGTKHDGGCPPGLERAGHVEVADSYDWDPDTLVPGLPAGAVVGVEAAVFTETLRTFDDLTTMLLPQLAAVAEVAWSPTGTRDLLGFVTRLAAHTSTWVAADWRWYASPQASWAG